ncbi:MAG: acyl carrier protein, partial [Prosthecobacter sp.]|nr:acyl carrier protein [Prosthecobacter sp.]
MKPPAPTLALVTQILCEQLGLEPDQVKPESGLSKDLGADSLDTVEIIMAFEEEFGLDIPDHDVENLEHKGNGDITV